VRRALVVAAVALAFPASAFAHASLGVESPTFGQRLHSAPREIVLRFDQVVEALPSGVAVLDRHGRNYATASRVDGLMLRTPLRSMPRGRYTVRWRAMSLDGHVVSGVYTFGVRVDADNVTNAVGAGGPTRAEDIVRWAWFLMLSLVVGGLGFRLLVAREPLGGRFYLVTGLGVVGVLEVAIVAFLLRCEDALQLPFADFFYSDLSPIAQGTRLGQAFVVMELGFALVAALLFLAWLSDRAVFLWPAFLLGLGFASGLSLSGHSANDPGSSWTSALADWAHLSAASLWIGGLVILAAVVWPLMPDARRTTFLAFSRLATVCVAVLLLAGVYLAILRLPQLSDLWSTGYGQVLLVKISLVCLALAWGGMHRLIAVPAVAEGRNGIAGRLQRSLIGESIVGMTVLLVAAILVNANPPG
jgi:copper transport protein